MFLLGIYYFRVLNLGLHQAELYGYVAAAINRLFHA